MPITCSLSENRNLMYGVARLCVDRRRRNTYTLAAGVKSLRRNVCVVKSPYFYSGSEIMSEKKTPNPIRSIALVAHDARKRDLVAWVGTHREKFKKRELFATGTTGRLIQEAYPDLTVTALKSGPLGGDQQLGAMIATGALDMMIFFTDPMTPLPHDVDVKALTRLSTLYDIPMACNTSTAAFLINSPLLDIGYDRAAPDVGAYVSRKID